MMAARFAALFFWLFAGVGLWRSIDAASPAGFAVAAAFLGAGVLLWTRGVARPTRVRAER